MWSFQVSGFRKEREGEMDWLTAIVEGVGVVIFCVWVVVPVREFGEIRRKLKEENQGRHHDAD